MLKMFGTQLTGLFKRIQEKEGEAIEDGARVLAQAAVGEGAIYIKGFGEMETAAENALKGPEPMAAARPWEEGTDASGADRVLVFTRLSTDTEAVEFAKKLAEQGILFVAISGSTEGSENLTELADVHIDTHCTKPLLPGENGERVGFPSALAALFVLHGIQFTMQEIIEEYN